MAFIPLAPLALLRWPDAVHLYLACGLLLYAAAVYGLLRLGWPQLRLAAIARDPRAVVFLAFAFGLAPIHTAFNSQNIVLIATGAALLSIYLLAGHSRPSLREETGPPPSDQPPAQPSASLSPGHIWIAAAAITASLCLKPTTGIFLLPWLVRDRRWKLIAGVAATCAIITAISLEPLLAHHGTLWLTNYRSNVSRLFEHGGNADVSHANYVNTDRIDLQLVLFAILNSRSLSSLAAFAVYAALLAAFFYRAEGLRQAHARDIPLLVAAGSLTLGMLPVYSRMYSAGVVLPLLLWCLLHLRLSAARWILLLLSDFLINSGALVRRLFETSAFATGSPRLWDATLGGHTCWLLLAVGFLLVHAMHQQSREVGAHAA
jgi:hypothetical protein